MRCIRPVFAALALALVALLLPAGVGRAQQAGATCSTLACPKCGSLCKAYCDREAAVCQSDGKRGCPARFRACEKGCTFELCAQCMPVQFVEGGKRFLPGKTELCRTPGALEKSKG